MSTSTPYYIFWRTNVRNLTLFTLSIINNFYLALIFMFLWNWFISPLGVIEINYFHSLGISFIYFIVGEPEDNKYYEEIPFMYTIILFSFRSIIWGIAWIIKDLI